MFKNDKVKRELGILVSEWIKRGGNMVVMDSKTFNDALESEGLTQDAKKPRRTIFNRNLRPSEKRAIQEYILSLPMSDVMNKPYTLEHNGFVYVFNTFRALYEENTTQSQEK